MNRISMLVVSVVMSISAPAMAYSGGDGTSANPYQIANKAELLAMAADTANYSKCFILTSDIDLTEETFTTAVIAPDTDNTQWGGFQGTQFTGIFDGNGHTINNLTIAAGSGDCVGLFGSVGSGGQAMNLGVVNANIQGRSCVGGLVGCNDGTISSCYATGSVNGTGSYSVGGLVGFNGSGTISSCYATGSVNGTDTGSVGGLVGGNDGTISSCYATGSVSGSYYVGGLVGYNIYGTISSCYATGSVSGTGTDSEIGGLVGHNGSGTISSCYATGSVSGTGTDSEIGGLVGYNGSGTISSSFWNTETSGQAGSTGGKGLTTVQMKTMSIYQNAVWTNTGWVMNDGIDYPHLSWENTGGAAIPSAVIPFAGGGTAADPYLIGTAQEFALLSWYSGILNKQIKLTADLDLAGIQLYPIGDLDRFTGVFDGNGHTISNAQINQPGSGGVGLFRSVYYGGQVRNLGVVNANIQGRDYVGGLVGGNSGTISSCYVTGSMSGTGDYSYVGGLVGGNSGTISSCYATGAVSGNFDVGGLVGGNSGTISSCYATGSVNGTGSYYVGGLVGYNIYGTISSCFWNMETSGKTIGVGYGSSTGVTDKTTAEMKTLSTFTDAGWDFDTVWAICERTNYPRLQWQIPAGDWVCPDGVNIEDLNYFVEQWLSANCTAENDYCGQRDMNSSGSVDMEDFAEFAQNWLEQ